MGSGGRDGGDLQGNGFLTGTNLYHPIYINVDAVSAKGGGRYLTDWLYLTGRNFIIIVPAGQTVLRYFGASLWRAVFP